MPGSPSGRRSGAAPRSPQPPGARSGGGSALHALPGHRSRAAEQNQRRVRKLQLEKKFMQEVARVGGSSRLATYQRLEADEAARHQRLADDAAAGLSPRPPRASPRRERAPRAPPIQPVLDFDGAARCVQATHGGATLWTGDDGGALSVRNGSSGDVVHQLQLDGPGVTIDALHATETHVWAGCSDGGVRIYDILVYLMVHEAVHHSGPVTCFTQTFGIPSAPGKVFTGSADGEMIKWDTEENGFERMATFALPQMASVLCMACHGFDLFAGGESGTILCVDTDLSSTATAAAGARFLTGHTGAVTSVLVQDGYLFSGARDGEVRVWNMKHGECVVVLGGSGGPSHGCAVTALCGDDVAHVVWSADAEGWVKVWDSRPDADFSLVTTLDAQRGASKETPEVRHPIRALQSYCTVDAIKAWSLAANGKNFVWYSEQARAQEAQLATIAQMDAIIREDAVEDRKWRECIRNLRAVDDSRKEKIAANHALIAAFGQLRTAYFRLYRYVAFGKAKHRAWLLADSMSADICKQLRHEYYRRLDVRRSIGRRFRRLQALCGFNKYHRAEKGQQLVYWDKLRAYVRLKKQQAFHTGLAALLESGTGSGLLRMGWIRWQRFKDNQRLLNRRQKMCAALLKNTTQGCLWVAYLKLRAYRVLKRKERHRDAAATIFGQSTASGLMKYRYRTLKRWRRLRKQKQQRQHITELLMSRFAIGMESLYWNKWQRWVAGQLAKKMMDDNARMRREHDELLAEKDAIHRNQQELLNRKQQLAVKERQLEEQRQREAAKAAEVRRARAELAELERKAREQEAARAARQEREKFTEVEKKEVVADIMAMLKARALNYSRDFPLITRVRSDCQHIGPHKAYLQAHAALKRAVVEAAGPRHVQEPGQRWRGLDRHLKDVPEHLRIGLLDAIKVLCISYDLLTEKEKEALETNDELIANELGRDGRRQFLTEMVKMGRKLEERRRTPQLIALRPQTSAQQTKPLDPPSKQRRGSPGRRSPGRRSAGTGTPRGGTPRSGRRPASPSRRSAGTGTPGAGTPRSGHPSPVASRRPRSPAPSPAARSSATRSPATRRRLTSV